MGFRKFIKCTFIVLLVIVTLLAVSSCIFSDATYDEMINYAVGSDIRSLYIEVPAADITIKEGDSFSVESNLKNITVDNENSLLKIKSRKTFAESYNDAKLVITVPSDVSFENVVLITGAGVLNADSIAATNIECDFGAGEINIGSMIAMGSAEIDGGAGKITISSGAMHNLDFDMGVGELNFTSALTGECEFDFGVGESNITLIGNKDNYSLDIERGVGSITIDGKKVTDAGGFSNGMNKVEISGGIGSINITFK